MPNGDDATLIRRRYIVVFDEVARSEELYYPRDGSNHMFWWEWAVRYNGETHWASEFDVIKHRSSRRMAYWVLSNGDVKVKIRIVARDPRTIYVKYYIYPLKRDIGNIVFYQGADFDIDGTMDYDTAFYERRTVYAVGEEGTYIGFRSINKRPIGWHVDDYSDMWSAIDEGQLNNANYYYGDIGVALAFDVKKRGSIIIALGFGSDLRDLSRALRVRLSGPMGPMT